MKILVLGATGRIGQHLLAQGLARGHEITVLVRYPEKLGPVQNRVRVVVGDALEARAVERAITGQKAVVYALGSRQLGPTTFFSRIDTAAVTSHGETECQPARLHHRSGGGRN